MLCELPISDLDAVFFNAFNTHNFDKLKTLLSEDLEFYHLGGVTNYDQNVAAFKKSFESDRRVLDETDIWPAAEIAVRLNEVNFWAILFYLLLPFLSSTPSLARHTPMFQRYNCPGK